MRSAVATIVMACSPHALRFATSKAAPSRGVPNWLASSGTAQERAPARDREAPGGGGKPKVKAKGSPAPSCAVYLKLTFWPSDAKPLAFKDAVKRGGLMPFRIAALGRGGAGDGGGGLGGGGLGLAGKGGAKGGGGGGGGGSGGGGGGGGGSGGG